MIIDTVKWGKYLIQMPAIAKGHRYVYRGYDQIKKREVAIKVYKNVNRGIREATIMKSYGRHPHLPSFYEYSVNNNKGYLIMEFVKGDKLNIPKKGPCRDSFLAVEITLRILYGLKHLHEHGILHFDIAHHNILIDDNNPETLKITDFCGSVRKDAAGVWRSNRRGGTVNFIPPEQQMTPMELYPCSDLYAVSRLCYWLMCRSFPKADGSSKLEDNDLNNILRKGMEINIKKRYQSASEFINVLQSWQSYRFE